MPEPVLAATVEAQDLSRQVTLSNPIEAIRVVDLAARTDGVVTEVLVEEGDAIEVGDVLARIDVAEQRAELARAKAQLQEREANFGRFQQLKDRDYIDEASFEAARAELAIAQSDVALWQTRVDFGEVTSTVNGTVIDRMIEPGEAISSNGVLFSIADLSTLVVRLGVSELDASV
jgi:membrane fusion protein (multidrug efflux system)